MVAGTSEAVVQGGPGRRPREDILGCTTKSFILGTGHPEGEAKTSHMVLPLNLQGEWVTARWKVSIGG